MNEKPNLGWRFALIACVFSLFLAGCSNQETEKLIGSWEGHAEGAEHAANKAESDHHDKDESEPSGGSLSVLSQFGFTISLDFAEDGAVQMSLAGGQDHLPPGSQPIPGEWRLVDAEKNRLTIEIETPAAAVKTNPTEVQDNKATNVSQAAEPNDKPEKRRFVLRWTEGEPDRFTLTEEEGEPHLGALIFHRVSSGDMSKK